MSILKVIKYPEPILNKKSQTVDVKKIGKEELRLVENMIETMYEEDGVGIAAPQINVPKRIIISSPRAKRGEEKVYFNPEIIEASKDMELGLEGCLSVPGISCEVWRSKKIKFQAYNLKGEKVTLELSDFPARVMQHEVDHLNGVLIIDRVDFNQRQTLLSGYQRL